MTSFPHSEQVQLLDISLLCDKADKLRYACGRCNQLAFKTKSLCCNTKYHAKTLTLYCQKCSIFIQNENKCPCNQHINPIFCDANISQTEIERNIKFMCPYSMHKKNHNLCDGQRKQQNDGCWWKGTYIELQTHIKICKYAAITMDDDELKQEINQRDEELIKQININPIKLNLNTNMVFFGIILCFLLIIIAGSIIYINELKTSLDSIQSWIDNIGSTQNQEHYDNDIHELYMFIKDIVFYGVKCITQFLNLLCIYGMIGNFDVEIFAFPGNVITHYIIKTNYFDTTNWMVCIVIIFVNCVCSLFARNFIKNVNEHWIAANIMVFLIDINILYWRIWCDDDKHIIIAICIIFTMWSPFIVFEAAHSRTGYGWQFVLAHFIIVILTGMYVIFYN